MAVTFDQIADEFERFRDFVLNDLDRIVAQPVGGNYAATTLIMVAYDGLAHLRGDQPPAHGLFGASLPDEWQPVAASLYVALRNGIVHGYDPKRIVIDGRTVELFVSWREHPHLELDGDKLFLHVRTMRDHLRAAFDDYERELRQDAALRDQFLRRSRRERTEQVEDEAQLEAWRALLSG